MKKRIKLSIQKLNGEFKIKIKIPIELENFFKNDSPQKSVKWTNENGGVDFYAQRPEWSDFIGNNYPENGGYYYDDFGSFLIKNSNYYNTAILRVKGSSQGIEMTCATGGVDTIHLENYIKAIGKIAKEAYKFFIQKINIKATITFEI